MKNLYKNKREEGFTIIEVLIVLAIAGLIMLIVFLAVPALQRTSRNNQARTEATNMLGAVSEFLSNNNGKLPVASVSGTAGSDAAKIYGNTKLQNITALTVEAQTGTTAPTATTAVLRLGAKCAAATGSTTPSGSGRQVALLYQIEDTSGNLVACQES